MPASVPTSSSLPVTALTPQKSFWRERDYESDVYRSHTLCNLALALRSS
jgi:hypothetical protein